VIGNFLGAVGENDVNPPAALAFDEAEASFKQSSIRMRGRLLSRVFPRAWRLKRVSDADVAPAGLLAKVGKLSSRSARSTRCPHSLPWVDAPLVIGNLLGGDEGLSDSGCRSRIAPEPLGLSRSDGKSIRARRDSFSRSSGAT
jgi:hypothetical protein